MGERQRKETDKNECVRACVCEWEEMKWVCEQNVCMSYECITCEGDFFFGGIDLCGEEEGFALESINEKNV